MIASAHRPQGIPKEMLAAAKLLWLFAMEEPNAVSWLKEIPALADITFNLPDRRFMALKVPLRPRGTPEIVQLFNEPRSPKGK